MSGTASVGRGAPRWVLAVVFAVGFGHAALYAVAFPPWAIEDEQQHVDYAWKVAFDHRLPSIHDDIDHDIVEGIFGTDRFAAYDMDQPEPTTESMGLQARSYVAYHPPAVYVALTPVLLVVGKHALTLLYVLRLLSALAAGAVAALTAVLAIDIAGRVTGAQTTDPTGADDGSGSADGAGDGEEVGPGSRSARRARTSIGLAAGITAAALPALADSGGRVDADIYATLVVVVGCLLILRWVDDPDRTRSWVLGAVLAVAVLTRETALVLAIPLIVAIARQSRTNHLDAGALARVLVAPLVASVAWIAYQWRESGYLDGSRGFLATYGDVITRPATRPLAATVGDALVVPFGAWGVPWVVVVGLAAAALTGLVLLARADGAVIAATAAGMLAFVALALFIAIQRDLNVATARLLLPAYPAVIAAATVGWATARSRWATFALTIPVVAFAVWFAAFELLTRYPPRLG